MTKSLGVIMDPIVSIHIEKDTTFAILLEAQARGWEIYYFEQPDLYLHDGIVLGAPKRLTVKDDPSGWFSFHEAHDPIISLSDLDTVLLRVDPPFNQSYLYTTYLLEIAQHQGAFVVNNPQSVRDCNEKIFATWFPECGPPTLVSQDKKHLKGFLHQHHDIIAKPLDNMGGKLIFRIQEDNPNISVIFDTLTQDNTLQIMVQKFIPEIVTGDKRILLIDGEPFPYALNRVPPKGELRANLAAGGTGVGVKLTDRDRWICEQIGPTLKEKGLMFVGIDVIGDYLTEINVTCPTGVRQIDAAFGVNISANLLDCIEEKLSNKPI